MAQVSSTTSFLFVLATNVRVWRQATFDPGALEQLGLLTAVNSHLGPTQDIVPEQILIQLVTFVFLLMDGQIWDTAWHHEAFPNRFATHLHKCFAIGYRLVVGSTGQPVGSML